ncbi:hypothetical protein PIROE2DRAFT_7230 [Piromyces sp. E2]|nr:hypothetical protein PIROE2DRAFT_7230 [Piromyces sp. E2]|eukprot:OUM65728.1 hypothetical protein PIROE2DRAFT_7230 [Piromyces sp. E2]
MIVSTIDNIPTVKNKINSNNDNINLLKETLKSLKTKTFNHINNRVTKDNSIIIGTNSQYNKNNNNTNYYVNSSTSKFEPVEYNFSRYILSLYSLVCIKDYNKTIPFYCYCKKVSKQNKDNIEKLYLGMHYEITSSSNVGSFYITEITNDGTFQYNKDIKENDDNYSLQITNILNDTFNQDDINNNRVIKII